MEYTFTLKYQLAADDRDTVLERIAALSADHFDVAPDDVQWGHVGTLAHYAELLKRITDSAFKEGEHAA